MVAASGEMQAAEASGALAAIGRRQRGSRTSYYLFMLALYATGALVGYLIGLVLQHTGLWADLDPVLAALVGIWLGAVAYVVLGRRWANARFRKGMAQRGLNLRFQYKLEATDEGLIRESAEVRSVAAWSAVTDLFRTKGYWVFLVQTAPWFLPSRFFPDQATEKAFLRAALNHMSPEARSRSDEAEKFAAI